jgi:hypothetical protein
MLAIPATWEAKIGRLWFEISPGKSVSKTVSKNKLDVMAHTCNPSCANGLGRRRIMV